jgi:UDP-glucose 4-epimerase
MKQKVIVVTGGAGYIGSHVIHNLLAENLEVVVLDDLSNGEVTNINPKAKLFQGDFADDNIWQQIVDQFEVQGVIHLAAYIEIDESFQKPAEYLLNNAIKTGQLLQILNSKNVKNLVFSSTCGVYGKNQDSPLTEQTPVEPLNPYANSKAIAERFVKYAADYLAVNAIIFRFFNTGGTLPEVNIRPKNQTALLSQVRLAMENKIPELKIFGNEFSTKDGTCVRDFVHVYDVARAVVSGMKNLLTNNTSFEVYNIGSENGFTVKEIVGQTEQLFGIKLNVKIVPPRPDEVVVSVASSQKLKDRLNFQFFHSDLENILKTSLS